MTGVTALVAFFLGSWIAIEMGNAEAASLMLLLPLICLVGGVFGIAEHWATRRRAFSRQATAEVVRSSVIVLGQIVGGLLKTGGTGLVLGRLVGSFGGLLLLVGQLWRHDGGFILRSATWKHIRKMATEYSVFPKYNMPRAGLRSLSNNSVAILLAFFFDSEAAGLYWFTYRLLQMPTTLIGEAVRRVFYQRAVFLFNESKEVLPFWKKTTIIMMAIGAVPTLIVVVFGPPLFEIVFGSSWERAGVYAQWVVVSWYFTFCNIPCATLIPIFRLQPFFLVYEIVAVIFRALMIVLGSFFGTDVTAVALYSILGVFLSLFLEFYVLYLVKRKRSKA
jgi:O-antigen/teichoic acid export membrane protein